MSEDFRIVLISPPDQAVVALEEIKAYVRVDASDDDGLVTRLADIAAGTLDPARGGGLDIALRPATWELRLPCFPAGIITLPYRPLVEVVSVKYDDARGDEQSLSMGADYRLFDGGPLARSRIAPAYEQGWPLACRDSEAVRIRYIAGHPLPAGDAVDALPTPIKQAIALLVSDMYEFRETAAVGVSATSIPTSATINDLLSPYRTYRV
jgi:uncharacterized phiE125 gp8 family phage protein